MRRTRYGKDVARLTMWSLLPGWKGVEEGKACPSSSYIFYPSTFLLSILLTFLGQSNIEEGDNGDKTKWAGACVVKASWLGRELLWHIISIGGEPEDKDVV